MSSFADSSLTWEGFIRKISNNEREVKMPALNGRFGASGGVGSSESEQVTSLLALVQTAVESPACRQAAGTLCAMRVALLSRVFSATLDIKH